MGSTLIPFIKNALFDIQHIVFCFLAAIADLILTLSIYLLLATIYKDVLWIKHLNLKRILIIILIGGIGAILGELRYFSEGNWAYSSSMPIAHFVNVGLSPLLQFMLLSILGYYLRFYFLKRSSI